MVRNKLWQSLALNCILMLSEIEMNPDKNARNVDSLVLNRNLTVQCSP